ncbi:hypothetical protein AVEN_214917-1 [Araneus ventricosus]|uniref:Uncharacterized protein n=1 Tax=Araneus ventricosus TaxID=182803 RepID=A0A4Y2DAZ0_ARAVE|nr:hypothetical protein AVEN_214917-1 [Araneus ventricosus]
MDKWLKTGTLERSASKTEIRTTDLAAMAITVDQQDDNHEVRRLTDWLFRTTLANEVAVLSETLYRSHSIAKVRKSKRFYDRYSKAITSVSVYKDEDIVLSSNSSID